MGGDDLASDDEYFFDSSSYNKRTEASSSDEDASSFAADAVITPSSTKKRKIGAVANATESTSNIASSSKKRNKTKNNGAPSSKSNLIIHAGRGIAFDGPDAQSLFFGTCYSHAVKLTSESVIATEDQLHDAEEADEETNNLVNLEQFLFQPHHFYANSDAVDAKSNEKQHSSLSEFLKLPNLIPSMKRLKNWKHSHSPMILIITLSARRCVDLQKQLTFLKLPVAKLFAKHMSVESQVAMLTGGSSGKNGGKRGKEQKGSGKCYGIGVGTPGRLLTLLRHGSDGANKLGALRLNHTELIIIDCHEDSKGFTVCTLKDTAKELMDLMKEGVVSELEKRKDKIKLALF
ncbi:hypothetical protein HJC23_006857 [Cyclotella cryptica]|uniref:Uncharacterized protein n=1 Tax=Cyclotella cryptica TaxID=29204 RepID=A0ABD3QD05_9STRA|eukprot:CCRYP_006689-RA/>CCRYP_006689-RA protein AED:0.17 eAED:0.17 QI:0/-1/0/1/-1/1/1/0/346